MESKQKDGTQRESAICFGAALAEELKQILELRRNKFQDNQNLKGKNLPQEIADMAIRKAHAGPCADGPEVAAREAHKVFDEAHKMNLVGLAFSGGGIRSATFNLGILQGLADKGLLRIFDYLSTVSGGGYIGSWLETWILRAGQDGEERAADEAATGTNPDCKPIPGIEVVEEKLKSARASREKDGAEKHNAEESAHTEPTQIRFLREYSNYLTPRRGLLSADTWTMVAIYMRNLLLNQAILVLFVISLLLLPYTAAWITEQLSGLDSGGTPYAPVAVVVLVTLALCVGARNLKGPAERKANDETHGRATRFWQTQGWVVTTVVAPLILAAWILTGWIWYRPGYWQETTLWWKWLLGGLVGFTFPWMISCALAPRQEAEEEEVVELRYRKLWWIVWSWVMGPIGGLLLFVLSHEVFERLEPRGEQLWYQVSFGVPLVLLIFLLMAVVQMGLMGRTFIDPYREWWARVAGWIFLLTLAWISISGLSFYAPLGLAWLGRWVAAAGGLAWVINTVIGVLGGQSSRTGALGSKTAKDTALSVTPFVFIVGLTSLLSMALALILARTYWAIRGVCVPTAWCQFLAKSPTVAKVANWTLNFSGTINSTTLSVTGTATSHDPVPTTSTYISAYWEILRAATNWHVLAVLAFAIGLCLLLSWRVNLNEFSMNLFYRNRLVRCYLGATRPQRTPHPLTGFDPLDDLLLQQLKAEYCYSGPFPIFNGTLNLVSTRDLAWQERKAESFAMTPLRCGYDTWLERVDLYRNYAKNRAKLDGLDKYAYRPTERYAYKDGGFYVGTAVGISGAALSPNMGYHSLPSLAILMTFFNVRLGFWAGNPRDNRRWTLPGPTVGLWRLLAELFGLTDDNAKFVYLSDGGHFENLGVYELVKRRCKYIIACDAGADPKYTLADLGNAVRKCREDIGVELELISSVVVPQAGENRSAWHCVVGKIHYDWVDPGAEKGTFVYVKASLTGDEPADVLTYQKAHTDFPHQATADQWFTESQFESYRRLGQHIITTMFDEIEVPEVLAHSDPLGTLFKRLDHRWGTEKAQQVADKAVGRKGNES